MITKKIKSPFIKKTAVLQLRIGSKQIVCMVGILKSRCNFTKKNEINKSKCAINIKSLQES